MFINLFCPNVGSTIGLNINFIQKCYVEVTDFSEELVWFNSVFIDNNGITYRGNGSSIPITDEFASLLEYLEDKEGAQFYLTGILIECLNNKVELNEADIDNAVFECLLNKMYDIN